LGHENTEKGADILRLFTLNFSKYYWIATKSRFTSVLILNDFD
jgi:hypothetical protein